MTLQDMIEYLKETGIETEAMYEIIEHLETLDSIQPIGLFSTPKDMSEMQNYLSTFNQSDGVVANTCAFMMFNMLAKNIKRVDK